MQDSRACCGSFCYQEPWGCIVLCFFFQVKNGYFQGILLVGLAGFLAMVLFVIIALDRPFVGDMGITAESYQLIYDHHMRR
jgi:hypothetical protein